MPGRPKVSPTIIADLRERIKSGKLRGKLHTTLLAHDYGISGVSMRRIYHKLQEEGLVTMHGSHGTYTNEVKE